MDVASPNQEHDGEGELHFDKKAMQEKLQTSANRTRNASNSPCRK